MMSVDMVKARQQAAVALEAGQRLALRAAQERRGLPIVEEPKGAALGALIGDPAAFWAGAAACCVDGSDDTVVAVVLATQLAGARLASGDMSFVRNSLIGQAQWLGVVAVQMLSKSKDRTKPEEAALFVKLALAAQRQAAQCLASAAALEKLKGAAEVTVVGE